MSKPPKGERWAKIPVRAATDSALKFSTLRVLIAVMGYVNKQGRAWPSCEAIGRDAGMDRRNVAEEIAALERAGYLKRAGWHATRLGRTRIYEAVSSERDVISPDDNSGEEDVISPDDDRGGVVISPDVLDVISPDAQTDHSTNHRKESDHLDAREARSTLSALPGFEVPSGGQEGKKAAREGSRGRKQRGKTAGRPRARPKTDIPPNWKPDPGDISFALERGITDIADQAARFVDHHRGKATTSTNFSLNWHTWCRNAQKWQAERDAKAAQPNGSPRRRDGMTGSLKRQHPAMFEHHGTTIDVEAETLA